jgi:hypothetical protein
MMLLIKALDAVISVWTIHSPDKIDEDPQVLAAKRVLDMAAATKFAFQISKHVNKKSGTAKIKAISAYCKAFQTHSVPRTHLLPKALCVWAGLLETAPAEAQEPTLGAEELPRDLGAP